MRTIKVSDEVYDKLVTFDGKSMSDKLNKALFGNQRVTSGDFVTRDELVEFVRGEIESAKRGY